MGGRDPDKHWRLYVRALDILEGRANGHALPILRMLTLRRFTPAQNAVGEYLTTAERLAVQRRAAATGDALSLYNLAIEYRNRGDLRSYRHWLGFAAQLDGEARSELKAFRRRFPHTVMRRFGMFAAER